MKKTRFDHENFVAKIGEGPYKCLGIERQQKGDDRLLCEFCGKNNLSIRYLIRTVEEQVFGIGGDCARNHCTDIHEAILDRAKEEKEQAKIAKAVQKAKAWEEHLKNYVPENVQSAINMITRRIADVAHEYGESHAWIDKAKEAIASKDLLTIYGCLDVAPR